MQDSLVEVLAMLAFRVCLVFPPTQPQPVSAAAQVCQGTTKCQSQHNLLLTF